MSNEHEITPDTSETWHNERQARVQAERQRVEAQEALISNAYAGCESEWAELDKQAKDAYASLDMEALDRIRDKREEVKERVKLLQNGNDALQQEKQQIEFAERATKLDFNSLREVASEKSKLFLDVFRSKLQDQASLRRLLHADSVARAQHTPDTNEYFAAIERQMGFKPEERRFTSDDEFNADTNTLTLDRSETKRTAKKNEPELNDQQKWMAANLPGVSPEEYASAVKNPFSQASATVEVEPTNDFDTGAHKPMEVSFADEAPKTARYKAPAANSKTSVTLSPTEKDICLNMASVTGRPVNEVLREFATNKIALRDGKAGHYQLYDAKLRSEGRA